jgi:hypothetical protein
MKKIIPIRLQIIIMFIPLVDIVVIYFFTYLNYIRSLSNPEIKLSCPKFYKSFYYLFIFGVASNIPFMIVLQFVNFKPGILTAIFTLTEAYAFFVFASLGLIYFQKHKLKIT